MAKMGSHLRYCPTLPGTSDNKRPLDLYKLYNLVQLYGSGGGSDNCNKKAWDEISELMGAPPTKSYILQNVYDRYLRSYEIHLTSGSSNNEAEDKSRGQEDFNFNLPTPVKSDVRGARKWSRKSKRKGSFKYKKIKSPQSVFDRLGKKIRTYCE